VILLLVALAYLWTRDVSAERWSWVRQFGTTSLLVYWVHIELVYGRWSGSLKNNLTVVQTVAAALILIVLMLVLSTLKTRRGVLWARIVPVLNATFRAYFPSRPSWNFGAKPQGAAGD
jgi:fucose 4-O-acetylase-like acetyltransferase